MARLMNTKGRMGIALAIAAVVIAAAVGIGFGITDASAASSKLNDAHGDNTTGTSALDIKSASVKKKGGNFEFTMKLVGSVEDALDGSNQWNFLIDSNDDCQEWLFCDPDDYLIGLQPNPFGPGYVAAVVYLTPGPPGPEAISLIDHEIDGKKISFTVPEGLIGDPGKLAWYANTRPAGFPEPEADLLPDGASNGSVVWEN